MLFEALLVISTVLLKTSVFGCRVSAPYSIKVTSSQSHRLSITWEKPLDDNNETLTYTVFYKSDLKVENYWNELADISDVKASLPVKPYRKYEIFIVAKGNQGSYSVPSEKYNTSDRTPSAAPEKCPTILDIGERSGGSTLGVQWDPVPEQYRNGQIKYHLIYYKNCSMTDWDVKNSTEEDYQDIDNVGPGPYSFKAVAYNAMGVPCKGNATLKVVSEAVFQKNECLTSTKQPPTTSANVNESVTTPPNITVPPTTTSANVTESVTTSAEITTLPPTTTSANVKPETTSGEVTLPPATTEKLETTQQPCPTMPTKEPDETNTKSPEAGKLSNKKDWLLYLVIALAVLVVIMGIAITILIYQLYKNHRFYKLKQREQQYHMSRKDNGYDNHAQDKP